MTPCIVLLGCIGGEMEHLISPEDALRIIFQRHIMNINNWAVNIKGLTIVHRVLVDKKLNQSCIKTLQDNYINYVIPYHFKNKSQKIRMFADVSEKYAKYLRHYIKSSEVITQPVSDQTDQAIIIKNLKQLQKFCFTIFDILKD